MTPAQKLARKNARYWGRATVSNHRTALAVARQAEAWARIVPALERQLAAAGDPAERIEIQDTIAHVRAMAEKNRAVSDHQVHQVYVNARRAFHAAIAGEGGGA